MTDCDVEGSEVFEVGMMRRPGLFRRIRLTESVATVTINDSICKSIIVLVECGSFSIGLNIE